MREIRKKLDRKTAEYDASRQKHLWYKTAAKAPSKWRKGDDPDKAHQLQQDMVHAQVRGEGYLLASVSAAGEEACSRQGVDPDKAHHL